MRGTRQPRVRIGELRERADGLRSEITFVRAMYTIGYTTSVQSSTRLLPLLRELRVVTDEMWLLTGEAPGETPGVVHIPAHNRDKPESPTTSRHTSCKRLPLG